jgi:hypothetical protein
MPRFFSLPFTGTVILLAGTILLGGVAANRVPEALAVPLDRIDSAILESGSTILRWFLSTAKTCASTNIPLKITAPGC